MRSYEKFLINSSMKIKDALKILEENINISDTLYILEDKKLIATLSSGDVRRAVIDKDINHDDNVLEIAHKEPYYIFQNTTLSDLDQERVKNFQYVPVVTKELIFLYLIDTSNIGAKRNKVVLMAGGLGTRLRPLTEDTPKPMLEVGGKPILETIIEQFKKHQIIDFYISVNYKAEFIKDYFGDGSSFSVSVNYLEEKEKLGTAGCLSLIKEDLKEPFFLMNGDILTDIDFEKMLQFHSENNFEATMCVVEHIVDIPFGVVESSDNIVESIVEKPSKTFQINAGIYLLNPSLVNEIPKNSFYNMPDLLKKLIDEDRKVGVFSIEDYWLDIGHPSDFQRARNEYEEVFK